MPSPEFRTRVESDVRFYVRQPSSPWITFDRQGNAPTLQSGHTSILNAGSFPRSTGPIQADGKTEASNMVVAADVAIAPAPEPRTARKALLVSSIGIALGAVLGLVIATNEGSPSTPATAVAPPAARHVSAAQPGADPLPPDLSSAGAATVASKRKEGFGRLVLRGNAAVQPVWMDGKLMLGSGGRQYMVACGDHTVAVGVKTNPNSVDVPCNGEVVITK